MGCSECCKSFQQGLQKTGSFLKKWIKALFFPPIDEEHVLPDYLPLVRRVWWVTLFLYAFVAFVNFGGVLYVIKAIPVVFGDFLPRAYLEQIVVNGHYWDQLYVAIPVWLVVPLILYFITFWPLYRAAHPTDSEGKVVKKVKDYITRKRKDREAKGDKAASATATPRTSYLTDGKKGSSSAKHEPPRSSLVGGKSKSDERKPLATSVDPENPELERVEYHRYDISRGRKFLFVLGIFGAFCAFELIVISLAGPFPAGGTGVVFQLQAWDDVKGLYDRSGGHAKVQHTLARTYCVATALSLASNCCWLITWAVVLFGIVFPLLREMRRQKAYVYILLALFLSSGLFALLLYEIIEHLPKGPSGRQLCFKNSCGEVVRVGQVGGSTGIPCSDGCPAGTLCNPGNGLCHFGLTFPETYLGPGGSECVNFDGEPVTARIHADTGLVLQKQQWSGSIYASTHCDKDSGFCETAVCNDCPAYQGPVGPVTQAEMTLLVDGKDYYDVTIINGVNIPLRMTPKRPANGTFAEPDDPKQVLDYWCTSPGDPEAKNPASRASWNFKARDNKTRYPMVVGGSQTPCDGVTSHCPSGEVCGVAMMLDFLKKPLPTVTSNVCGKLSGVWSDDALCAWTDATSYLDCKAPLGAGTVEQLFGCYAGFHESCFQNGVSTNCCGCTVWEELGIKTSEQCKQHNPLWESRVKPNLQFLKEACPSCYTYPYDDPTSTFTCKSDGPKNLNSYEIEFCPKHMVAQFE